MLDNQLPLKYFGTLIKQPALKRVVAFDEGRFGLITWFRRRWCPLGERPPWIVLDSSGSHHSGEVKWPVGTHPLYLPRYSPELNPAEQVFRQLHMHLSNTVFTTLDELQNALIDELQQFWEHARVLWQLVGRGGSCSHIIPVLKES